MAAGLTVVNSATTFASPTRQTPAARRRMSSHAQPEVAERRVRPLRGWPIRAQVGHVGFDAYGTMVGDCDHHASATLWEGPPAPQYGERDPDETLIERMARFDTDRFWSLPERISRRGDVPKSPLNSSQARLTRSKPS